MTIQIDREELMRDTVAITSSLASAGKLESGDIEEAIEMIGRALRKEHIENQKPVKMPKVLN